MGGDEKFEVPGTVPKSTMGGQAPSKPGHIENQGGAEVYITSEPGKCIRGDGGPPPPPPAEEKL